MQTYGFPAIPFSFLSCIRFGIIRSRSIPNQFAAIWQGTRLVLIFMSLLLSFSGISLSLLSLFLSQIKKGRKKAMFATLSLSLLSASFLMTFRNERNWVGPYAFLSLSLLSQVSSDDKSLWFVNHFHSGTRDVKTTAAFCLKTPLFLRQVFYVFREPHKPSFLWHNFNMWINSTLQRILFRLG